MWFDNDYEPKMPFKFRASLSIGGKDLFLGRETRWYNIKSVDRPSFEISIVTHKHLNTEVKFPTNVRWNAINLTMVDIIDNEVLISLKQYYNRGFEQSLILQKQNYKNNSTIEKTNSFSNLLTIQQLSSDGSKTEEWVVENFHIKSFTLQQANYDTDGLSTVSMVLEYDWAYIINDWPADMPQLLEDIASIPIPDTPLPPRSTLMAPTPPPTPPLTARRPEYGLVDPTGATASPAPPASQQNQAAPPAPAPPPPPQAQQNQAAPPAPAPPPPPQKNEETKDKNESAGREFLKKLIRNIKETPI